MDRRSGNLEKGGAPSVAIDGARIRSIRETKKLTQLYVASVVGVTTDTISRWENNRYPSIKRDNAEKLAGALEVELTEILRQGEVPRVVEEARTTGRERTIAFYLVLGVATLAIIFIAVYFLVRRPPPTLTALRWAPRYAAPGEVIPVQIKITRRAADSTGFIVKERIPDGFRMVGSMPKTSSTDGTGSGIKWLIPGGSAATTISYTLQVPATPGSVRDARLGGEVVVRAGGATRTEPVTGSILIRIGPYHWADTNGDGRIDDDEIMPAYYVCEEMKGLGLDWPTIEAIWSGKGYSWDPQRGYLVRK